jgi:hypothetical protein
MHAAGKVPDTTRQRSVLFDTSLHMDATKTRCQHSMALGEAAILLHASIPPVLANTLAADALTPPRLAVVNSATHRMLNRRASRVDVWPRGATAGVIAVGRTGGR